MWQEWNDTISITNDLFYFQTTRDINLDIKDWRYSREEWWTCDPSSLKASICVSTNDIYFLLKRKTGFVWTKQCTVQQLYKWNIKIYTLLKYMYVY